MVTGFSIGITENFQDAAKNISNVTVALTITWNGGSYNATGNATGILTIDGTNYDFSAKFNTSQKVSGSEVIYSQILEIPHNEDGSKSLSCSASFITGTMVGTVTASATKTLTHIPRESTIGATDANVGAISLISINRKNTDYAHSVAYSFGELSGYLADGDGRFTQEETKFTAVSIAFFIPEEFYGQIPKEKSGLCTLTVRTYWGDTQIGEDKTCVFTVTAAEETCRPEVTGQVVDICEQTLALTGSETTLVRGMSTAKCTLQAQAKNGATLAKKTIEGTEIAENEHIISNAEGDIFRFSAIDSRGYTSIFELPVAQVAYVKLTCNTEALRTDPTSGNAVLTVNGNYFDGDFGAAENELRLFYQIGGGAEVEITPNFNKDQYTASAALSGLDYQRSHTITVTARDKLMTVTKTLTVGKGIPVFDWGENDFSFHVPVSVMGVPLQSEITSLGELDGFTFQDSKFHLGYGDINGQGYISFNIGKMGLQFQLQPDRGVWIRTKHQDAPWGQWTQIVE